MTREAELSAVHLFKLTYMFEETSEGQTHFDPEAEKKARKTEQYKCQSYYDDNNVLQDCTCGKCDKEEGKNIESQVALLGCHLLRLGIAKKEKEEIVSLNQD